MHCRHGCASVTILNPHGILFRPTGRFVRGFPPWRRRPEFEFHLDPDYPLTLRCDPGGYYVQPDRHGLTDFGSVPEPLQGLVNSTYAPASFVFHDSGCREGGLYFSRHIEGPYTFCPMESASVHRLLRLCVRAERRNPVAAAVIWAAVRVMGPRFPLRSPAN
jgi:hypothetical protein